LHHAYTAPLRSFSHFGPLQARTPKLVQKAFPKSFSVVFADGINKASLESEQLLTSGVRDGDVLMINSWYVSDDTDSIKKIYKAANLVLSSSVAAKGDQIETIALIEREAAKGSVELLFLGDSITASFRGSDIWKERFLPRKALNAGVPSDRTENVLWRLQQPEMKNLDPKAVILQIGMNNLGQLQSVNEVAIGIAAIVNTLRDTYPQSNILLMGIFPYSEDGKQVNLRDIVDLNARISQLGDGKRVDFFDITGRFLDSMGNPNVKMCSTTSNLTANGLNAWAEAIEPRVARALEAGKNP
jgi:beta-glucosidase